MNLWGFVERETQYFVSFFGIKERILIEYTGNYCIFLEYFVVFARNIRQLVESSKTALLVSPDIKQTAH